MNKICILYEFHEPPYGGGNQFLLALRKAFARKGLIVESHLGSDAPNYIINSFEINPDEIKQISDRNIIHRVVAPAYISRGENKQANDRLDQMLFGVNHEYADYTVFQSQWALNATLKYGYDPVSPVVINNACDSEIFNRQGKVPFMKNRKVRLIMTSWSNNPQKGLYFYKWMDENLDWDKYEFTYLGRLPKNTFKNIKVEGPYHSRKVAEILKRSDILVTATQNDACSNTILEALSCGLPVLYLKSGGNHEIVKQGGIGFTAENEIPTYLNLLVSHYEKWQKLIEPTDIDKVADKYIGLMKD